MEKMDKSYAEVRLLNWRARPTCSILPMELKTLAPLNDYSLRRIKYDSVKNFSFLQDLNKTTSNVQQTHISTRWCFTPTILSVTLWQESQGLHKSNRRLWCWRTVRLKNNPRVPKKVCPRKTKSPQQSLRSQLIHNRKSLTVLGNRQFKHRIQVFRLKKALKRKRLYLCSSNSWMLPILIKINNTFENQACWTMP